MSWGVNPHNLKLMASCGIAASVVFGSAPLCAQVVRFDIPSGSGGRSIPELARQAGVPIIGPGEVLQIIVTPEVKGTFDVVDALELMLKGTDLMVSRTAEGVITISFKKKNCNDEGETMLRNSKNSASVIALLFGAFATPACLAQGGAADTSDTTALETVVITGSRIAVSSGFDAPTPVSVIDADQIKFSGNLNLETILNSSPQFGGSKEGGPSSNTQQANGNSGAAYANLRNLNNATNVPRTLVLVNGRRFTVGGVNMSTDLNTIPNALIERTEIVTGGSSAVYGSDAIAGVLNFVLKQNFEGTELQAHVGLDHYTATPEYSFDLTVGSNFDHNRGNIAVSMDYLNRGGVRQNQVDYSTPQVAEGCVTRDSWSRIGLGAPNGATAANCATSGGRMGFVVGGSTATPEGRFTPVYNGSDPTLASLYAAAKINASGFTFDPDGTARTIKPDDMYNNNALKFLQMPTERWMINSFAHYELAPWATAFAELHFSSNTVDVELTPSGLTQTLLIDDNNPYLSSSMQAVLAQLDHLEAPSTTIQIANKFYSTTRDDGRALITANRRLVENGNRTDLDTRVAWRFAGGFRGDLGSPFGDAVFKDLSYETYYTYARTNDTNWLSGMGSRSAIQNALLSVNGAAPVCDFFGKPLSPDCAQAIGITSSYTTKAKMAGALASLSGTAVDLPAGPLQFNMGAEWRFSWAQYIPDQLMTQNESTGFNWSSPTKGSTTVKELFGEIRVPLLKDLPAVRSLTANAAFRNSCYNITGTGCVWTYSSGGTWQITDDVAFRADYQRAIRAPSVGELFGGSALNFITQTIDPCGSQQPVANRTAALQALCIATGVPAANLWTNTVQDSNKSVGTTSAGNRNLDAEKAETLSYGVVLTPTFIPGLQASFDWYSIYIKGAIGTFGPNVPAVLNNCYNSGNTDPHNLNCTVINRDQFGAIQGPYYVNLGNVNAGSVKTMGVDYVVNYQFAPGFSVIGRDSTIAINTAWTEVLEGRQVTSTGNVVTCLGLFGLTCQEPAPVWKGLTSVTWREGPLTVNLRWRFIDEVLDDRIKLSHMPRDQVTVPVFPTYHYFDLSASYDINDNLNIAGGVNDIFNLTAPTSANSTYANTWPSTYDAFGRMFFFNLTAKTN